MPKTKPRFTPTQLEQWGQERQSTAENLMNPRTGKSIQRNGPTYGELEQAYAKYCGRKASIAPEPEKAAAPRDKITDALAIVMQDTARRDPRTAAKLGMLTTELKNDYLENVHPDTKKRVGLVFDDAVTKDMMYDAMKTYIEVTVPKQRNGKPRVTYRLMEPSGLVMFYISNMLNSRLAYLREITRRKPVEELRKPTNLPIPTETFDSVWGKYLKNYKDRRSAIRYYVDYELQNTPLPDEASLTPVHAMVMHRIYNHYDVTKEVALFYMQFITVYMKRAFFEIMQRYFERRHINPRAAPPRASIGATPVQDIELDADDIRGIGLPIY